MSNNRINPAPMTGPSPKQCRNEIRNNILEFNMHISDLEKEKIHKLIDNNINAIEESIDDYEISYSLRNDKYNLYIEKSENGLYSARLTVEELDKTRQFSQLDSEQIYNYVRNAYRTNRKQSMNIVMEFLLNDSELA